VDEEEEDVTVMSGLAIFTLLLLFKDSLLGNVFIRMGDGAGTILVAVEML
jgi:hypothetical protein